MQKDESTELEQMMKMLQNSSQWKHSMIEEKDIFYYIEQPEFWIERVPCQFRRGYEYYLFNQTDSWPDWYEIHLYHQQKMLGSFQGVYLDGQRYFSPIPETRIFSVDKKKDCSSIIRYKYFVQESVRFILHRFFYFGVEQEEQYAHDCFEECVLFFQNDEERYSFEKYVKIHWDCREELTSKIWVPYFENIPDCYVTGLTEEYENVQILKILQCNWALTSDEKIRNWLP